VNPRGRAKPQVPDALSIDKVLAGAEPLQRLQQRLRDSNARFDAVRACLPPALLPSIKAGPLDDDQWTLLVSNQAVAAKLKHLQPYIESALNDQGWRRCVLRIKVQPSHSG
jgi:hypothetical protein